MLGLKSTSSAPGILSGIEMIHMMRKQQSKYAGDRALSLYE
jgi:transposase-like protein